MRRVTLFGRLGLIVVGLAVAAFVVAGSAYSLGTWKTLAPVPTVFSEPGEGVEGMSVGVVGNRIIAAYGLDEATGDTTTTRIYNIAHDSWTFGSDGPDPTRSEGAAVTQGANFYAIGGRGPEDVLADIDRYKPATDTWVSLTDMPTARAGLAAAAVGNAIYAIGGRLSGGGPCSQGPGGELATVERYDIATDTWSAVASLPSARSDLAAVASGGKIYVFGGCQVNPDFTITFLADVDVYDPLTDTWSTAPADMPTARAAMYGAAVAHNRLYVIGGWAGGEALATNEFYTVPADAWASDTPMLTPRGEMGVVGHGGRIYTVGGAFPAFGVSSDANEVFKP